MKRIYVNKNLPLLVITIVFVIFLFGLMGFGTYAADETTQDSNGAAWQEYNGKRLGVLTGTLMEDAAKTYFPDCEYFYFNSYPDLNAALLAGKIDAYLGDEPGVKSIHAEQPKIDYIHDRITNQDYSFAFRKNDPDSAVLCAELNGFIDKIREDGTPEQIFEHPQHPDTQNFLNKVLNV